MTIEERLDRIERMLGALVDRQQAREWYSVEEFSRIAQRSEFTCRDWCRKGRISAIKKESGRGAHFAWAISHQELVRYQREGLRQCNRGRCEREADTGITKREESSVNHGQA